MIGSTLSDLSIVVPLDFSRRSKDIFQRAIDIAKSLAPTGLHIIFGCATTPEAWVSKLKSKLKRLTGVSIITSPNSQNQLSKLRNIALAQVTTPYVLFLDVDIVADAEQIQQALTAVRQSPKQICMYPCLYLSAKGNRQLSKHPVSVFRQYYYQFKREWILHLAFPSSIIICDLKSVHAIQGFDESYKGHGYEDFDFMLRLFKHKELIEYTEQILIDEPYMAPMMATGFRALLSKAQLEQLLQPIYFVHLYHSKDKQENYYQLRQQNQNIFHQKFCALTTHTIEQRPCPLLLMNHFFELLAMQNKKPSEFTALWAEIPGHMFRKRPFFKLNS